MPTRNALPDDRQRPDWHIVAQYFLNRINGVDKANVWGEAISRSLVPENKMEDMDMLKNIKRLLKDEEAPTAVEYALMVAGVAVLIIAAVWFLGGSVSNKFTEVSASITSK